MSGYYVESKKQQKRKMGRAYIDTDEVVRMYVNGSLVKDIAIHFGTYRKAIRDILKNAGVFVDSRKFKRLPKELPGGRTLALNNDGTLEEIRTCYD